MLEIIHVTAEDENIIYRCVLATPKQPSISINLMVHPSNWQEATTTPHHQPQSQDIQKLASTGTSDTGSSGNAIVENISPLKMVFLGLIALKLQLEQLLQQNLN